MKYTKRDREQAILICQIAASGGIWQGSMVGPHRGEGEIACALGLEYASAPAELARNAWGAAWNLGVSFNDCDAEAECLLRDGWSPGDPVVRLGGAP